MSNAKPIIQYEDLLRIPTQENNEPCVMIQEHAPEIVCAYKKQDMVPLFGQNMYARESLVKKLKQAQSMLAQRHVNARLKVVYAYRDIDVQKKYFNARMEEMRAQHPEADERDLVRRAHLLSASPDVAGHPTGGAIDITITDDVAEWDMGGTIADFTDTEKIQTFYPEISDAQKDNRMMLRDVLLAVGFAPFDGEWWHFCYGDKEWASYYEKSHAIYGPIKIKNLGS